MFPKHPRVWLIFLCVFVISACSEGHPDDQPGAVNNPHPDVAVRESSSVSIDPADSGMTYSVPVTFSRAAPEAGSIRFRTVAGTALAGRDFTQTNDSVSFSEGQRQLNIPVELFNDSERSVARDFRIELTGANNAFLTENVSHTITLTPREQPNSDGENTPMAVLNLPTQISWVAPTQGTYEYSVVIPFSQRLTADATVEVRVVPGSARLGEHIDSLIGSNCADGVCEAKAGATELTFKVPVRGGQYENDRSFRLQFLSPEGLELPQQREVEVTLTYTNDGDAELPSINAPQGLTLRMPTADRTPLAYPIVFTLSQPLQEAATIEWRTVDDTAFADTHYVAVDATGANSVELDAGVREFGFELELLHDPELTDNVNFQLQLVSAQGLTLPQERLIDVEVTNSNAAGVVTPSISLPTEVVYHEPLETKLYDIYLPLSEAIPQDGSLRVSLIELSARDQVDFMAYTSTVDVSANSTEVRVPLELLYNPEETEDRELRVELSAPQNLLLNAQREFTVRIVDSGSAAPEPLLQLTPDLIRVPTPAGTMDPQEVTLYFELSDSLPTEANVTVRSRNGSAATGIDFNEVALVSQVVEAGNNELEVTLTLLPTTSAEPREFELLFSHAEGMRLPESRSVTVQIDPRNTPVIPELMVPGDSVVITAPQNRGTCDNNDRDESFCRRLIALPFSDFSPLQGRLRVVTQDRTARNTEEFELLNEVISFAMGAREVIIPLHVEPTAEPILFELILQTGTNLQLPDIAEDRVITVVIEPY